MSTAPAAAETHVRTASPGVSCSSPVRRSRTAPERSAPDARVADAHAAAVRQQRAGLLAGDQQRRGAVGVNLPAAGQEPHAAALGFHPGGGHHGAEALEVQPRERRPRARSAR